MNFAQAFRQRQDQRDAEEIYQGLVDDNENRKAYGLPTFEPSMELAEKIIRPAPRQSMREFFERSDIRSLQEVQRRNPPDSEAHRKATRLIRDLAEAIGAGEYFE